MTNKYTYKEPEGKLYKVSIRKWNKYFGNRGKWPFLKAHIWVNESSAEVHFYYTIWAKLTVTMLYPALVVCDGYKDANREVYRSWNNRKCGSFSCDKIYNKFGEGFTQWTKLQEMLND